MPSTATTRNRFEKQGSGENINSWGTKLNQTGLDLIDASLDGIESYTLSGSKTLTSTNYAADQSRMRGQNITGGTGGDVTIPSVQKWYLVRNNTSGNVVFTTGAGDSATIAAGQVTIVLCDGTNCYTISLNTYVLAAQAAATAAAASAAAAATAKTNAETAETNAETAETNAETAQAAAEAARNAAQAAQAAAEAALLPSQTGNAGKFLTTNGTTPLWAIANLYFVRQTADRTLTSTTATQKLFNETANGAITLSAGHYSLVMVVWLTGMSATSGNATVNLLGAGTATLGTQLLFGTGLDQSAAPTAGPYDSIIAVGANTIKPAASNTGTALAVLIRGTFSVTSPGTIIPSVALDTAAAATVKAGTSFVLNPLGTTAYLGSWS